MRKLVLKLLRFAPILIAVVAINFTVDPSNLFGNGRMEREMATIMLGGQNVSNVANYDDRLLQRFYVNGLREGKQVVVLGSSRSMLIRSSDFSQESFYNASVAGVSVQDYITIYQLFENRGLLPKTLVVEVSPWIFNKNNEQIRWKSLRKEYLEGLTRLGLPIQPATQINSLDWEKYGGLVSLPYLQESLRWLTIPADFYATEDTNTGEQMKLSDGSRIYDAESQERGASEVRQIALESLAAPYSLSDFNELDSELQIQFETWVISVQNEGVEVILFLSPYHPDYYSALIASPETEIIIDIEAYLRSFAQSHDLEIIGSYDPSAVGCNDTEFYDGLHGRESCLAEVFSQLQVP